MICDRCKAMIEKVKFHIGDKQITVPVHIMCFDMECENGGNAGNKIEKEENAVNK